jgi:putative membrane protein
MTNEKLTPEKKTDVENSVLPKDNNTFMAVERTVMGADRSLMAWLRTGLSLISFGFTIYKFLEYQRAQLVAVGKEFPGPSSPKLTGLILIGMGVFCLVVGIIEYLSIVTGYRKKYNITRPPYSLYISGIIALIGVLLFFGILFKMNGIG